MKLSDLNKNISILNEEEYDEMRDKYGKEGMRRRLMRNTKYTPPKPKPDVWSIFFKKGSHWVRWKKDFSSEGAMLKSFKTLLGKQGKGNVGWGHYGGKTFSTAPDKIAVTDRQADTLILTDKKDGLWW